MIVLLGVAFISGLLTILAPCIWPLLPIVLSDVTLSQSKRRPLGITAGVALSFTFFTLTISVLESSLGLNANVLRLFAVVVLVGLGISMIIPKFSQLLESRISRLSGRFGHLGKNTKSDFRGGFITGLALGVVWAPCSGPILASIATLAATNKVSLQVVFVTLFYVAGVSIPLFGFAVGGQKLLVKSRTLSRHTGKIQIVAGALLLVTAVAIYTNYDKTLEAKLLNAFPSYSNALTKIESSKGVTDQLKKLKGQSTGSSTLTSNTSDLFNTNSPAPEFTGLTQWLNPATPLSLASLRGKVVLVDFWTYTCINCIRTLPHVTQWYDKYKNSGFVVVGVHTPEFAFEKDQGNVLSAIKRFKIHYPVAQDNSYNTWSAYNNQYWPAEYLIDANGVIRREEFGEGNYDKTELAIRTLLKEAGNSITTGLATAPDLTPIGQISPETYVGSNRMQYQYPLNTVGNGTGTFPVQKVVPLDHFAFGGKWTISQDSATAFGGSSLTYHFNASDVYVILRPPVGSKSSKVQVLFNGKPFLSGSFGSDVVNGMVTVNSDRLYNIFHESNNVIEGTLTLRFLDAGTRAYTYTFG
ncbi:MAG: cytochrome c biogenesis protein DipZ [Actinomycetes bacterium]